MISVPQRYLVMILVEQQCVIVGKESASQPKTVYPEGGIEREGGKGG